MGVQHWKSTEVLHVWEEHRLGMFWGEVTRKWGKLHNVELHDLHLIVCYCEYYKLYRNFKGNFLNEIMKTILVMVTQF